MSSALTLSAAGAAALLAAQSFVTPVAPNAAPARAALRGASTASTATASTAVKATAATAVLLAVAGGLTKQIQAPSAECQMIIIDDYHPE